MNRKTGRLLERCGGIGPCLEMLEARKLLSGAALPTLADLSDPSHAVMRLGTEVGTIDVELFGSDAAAELVARINAGDLDESFFHDRDGATLRTAAFRFTDGGGLSATAGVGAGTAGSGDAAAERTVAVLPSSGELIFNLADNSGNADLAGAVVIGRIVNDASWGVVQSIVSLGTADLSGALGGSLTAVPVAGGFQAGDAPSESALIEMQDIELVKFAGDSAFLDHEFFYPEGFAGSTINEFLPMMNPNGEAVSYQVIARFEVGQRDMVIATGVMQPHARGGITISQFEHPELNLVPQGAPYALEVHATAPVSANLSHYDFGTATGEAFTTGANTTWVIADGRKASGTFDFVVWQNITGQDGEVTVTFYPEDGSTVAPIVMKTDAHRRNGLNISNVEGLPEGRFSVRLESTQPIVAAMTHYDEAGEKYGFTTLGSAGDGSTVGVTPLASFATDAAELDTTMSFMYFLQQEAPTLIREGTYRLGNHPDGSAAAPGYGLRLDGLFASGTDDDCPTPPEDCEPHDRCDDHPHNDDCDGDHAGGDRHQHQNGQGHHSHGNGHGYGHDGDNDDCDGDHSEDDRHQHQQGQGHHSHGNGHGYGHYGDDDDCKDDHDDDCDPVDETVETFTFDFENELSDMQMTFDGATIHIFGHAFGGRDIGETYADDEFLGVYQIDFTYTVGLGQAAGDDDLVVTASDHANTGTITTPGGEVISLGDQPMTGYSFRLGNEDDDLGHRGFDGISGHGWLTHGGNEYIESGDWLFTAEFIPVEPDPAVIDLVLDFEDPEIEDLAIPGALSLMPNTRGTVDLASLVGDVSGLLGERFSVHYASSAAVHASLSLNERGDGVSAATGVAAGRLFMFSEGFMDPARAGVDVFESIAAYNPSGAEDATVTIRIMYADGHEIELERVIAPGATGYVDLHAEDAVLNEGVQNQRYFYAICVTSDLPVVAQMEHMDLTLGGLSPSGGFSTLGTAMGELTALGEAAATV